MNRVTEETNCRICKGELETILDLGEMYPSAFVKDGEEPSEEEKVPMVVVKCKKCGLVQLKHTVDLDILYRQYWYSSSLNKSMINSLQELVREIESRLDLVNGDTVLDIGANDGTMLNLYKNFSILNTIAVDPARNLSHPNCTCFINDYFTANSYWKYRTKRAKVVTAVAMFYDLPDPTKFVEDVISVLDSNGVFVIQYTDLCSMLKVNAVDNFCNEHIEYYSFVVVKNLLESCGLQVIDVSHNDVNGASIRVTAAFPEVFKVSENVQKEIEEEEKYLTKETFDGFVRNIENTKMKVKSFLVWAKEHKHRVYIMGASTKGNTLLQICGVTNKDCEFASEVNKDKFGLKTVGSNIRIISEEEALRKHPDYFLCLPWHFRSSLVSKAGIKDYLNSNGKIVFPLPEFTVVSSSGEFKL